MFKYFYHVKLELLFLYLFIILLVNLPAIAQSPSKPIILPTKYDAHHSYVQSVTTDGTTLNFLTDSGGGLFVFWDVIECLNLPVSKSDGSWTASIKLALCGEHCNSRFA